MDVAAWRKQGSVDSGVDASYINSSAYLRRERAVWRAWFLGLLGLTLLLGLALWGGLLGLPSVGPASLLAWFLFSLGLAITVARPRYAIYLVVFFSLLGDSALMPAYPFNKNLSSVESLLYLSSALSFNPVEIYLAVATLSWLLGMLVRRRFRIYFSPLSIVSLVLLVFVIFGLAWGLSRGGDFNIALWEVRTIFYMPLLILLVTNLFDRPAHIDHLLWAAMLALFLEVLLAIGSVLVARQGDLGGAQAIAEHSMSIHQVTLFVLLLSAWIYRASWTKRFLLPLMAPFFLLALIYNQRRSAYLVFLLALLFLSVVLYRQHRQLFWVLVPPLAVAGLLYLVRYWSGGGFVGLPLRSLSSITDPGSLTHDQLSNLYRVLENINIRYTIHAAPLTGIGFGHKFYRLVPLPDISVFVWYEYITHNSILWIWMQTGIGGFFTLILLIGMALAAGVRATWQAEARLGRADLPWADLTAAGLTATLYIGMHFLYAYVDMSWEAQSMVYVGAMMGVIGVLERIVGVQGPALAPDSADIGPLSEPVTSSPDVQVG